jgi:AraC-like DNA-binding protein
VIGCSRFFKAPARLPQSSDSLYTARAALKVYGTQPGKALSIIDSALAVGNVSPFRAQFVRAKIYANSLEGLQRDQAIAICEELLNHDSTQVVDKATAANRNNVLDVMMDACRKNKDDEKWLRYAIERAQLSRDQGMEVESLRMEAEIGAAMTHVGRREEGMIRLEQAIGALDKGSPSVDRMDAGIVARKRRIAVLDKAGRYLDIISDAQAILDKLDDYQSRPSAYAEDSFRLPPDGQAHSRYCDFYRAQAHSYLATAYCMMTPPDYAKAREYARQVEESAYGKTFSGRWSLAHIWKALGQWDKLLAVDEEAEHKLGDDTLNTDYATILKDRADAAKAKGQLPQALSYMGRYSRLQEQLNEQRLQTEAQEYAARYHALEQEQKIREAEVNSARKDAILTIVAVLLILLTTFTIYSVRQQRAIGEKNRALVRMIGELNNTRKDAQADAAKPDKELFELIDGVIRKEKLYANVNLQRQDIVDRFDISRHYLNDLLSAYANGLSFPAYINEMRMQDALRMLEDEPEVSIGLIADAVGFTPANFREQFKKKFGMTPAEYRQNL